MKRIEIILSGSGGQGLLLAGLILAEAALKAGWHVAQSQSHGPEARGGASKSEVIISDEEINYPQAEQADVLLVMNEESCAKYLPKVKEGGLVLADRTYVSKLSSSTAKIVSLSITKTARERLGKTMVANMVALGALVTIFKEVPADLVEQVLVKRAPPGTEKINREAFQIGRQLAEKEVFT